MSNLIGTIRSDRIYRRLYAVVGMSKYKGCVLANLGVMKFKFERADGAEIRMAGTSKSP